MDGVVLLAVEGIAGNGKVSHVLTGYGASLRADARVQPAAHQQSRLGRRGADQVDNDPVADERPRFPVHWDERIRLRPIVPARHAPVRIGMCEHVGVATLTASAVASRWPSRKAIRWQGHRQFRAARPRATVCFEDMHAASRAGLEIGVLRTFTRFTPYAVGPIAAVGRAARAGYRGDWDRALPHLANAHGWHGRGVRTAMSHRGAEDRLQARRVRYGVPAMDACRPLRSAGPATACWDVRLGALLEHSRTPTELVMDPSGPWQQGSTRCAEQSAECGSIHRYPDVERQPA